MAKKKTKAERRKARMGWFFVGCFAIPALLFLAIIVYSVDAETRKEFFSVLFPTMGLVAICALPIVGIVGIKTMIYSDAIDTFRHRDDDDEEINK